MSEEARRARAEERRHRIVLTRTQLNAEDELIEGTPAERVRLAVELARAAWAMTGNPWPEPGSACKHVRFVPRSEA